MVCGHRPVLGPVASFKLFSKMTPVSSLRAAFVRHAGILIEATLTPVARLLLALDNRGFRRAAFRAHSSRTDCILADKGTKKFIVLTSDKVLSKSVYVSTKNFEFEKLAKAITLLGPKFHLDTLVDVGANIGTVCIPAVKRGIARKAIAIEPEPRNYALLVANIYLNGMSNAIEHLNTAFGPADNESLEFELSEDNSGDHRIRVTSEDGINSESRRRVIRVRSERFDTRIRNLDKHSSLVKIDTQGYEGLVLQGAAQATSAQIPMVLEFWPYGLKRTGSFLLLKEAISQYRCYFDLSQAEPEPDLPTAIDSLYDRLGERGPATDILLSY